MMPSFRKWAMAVALIFLTVFLALQLHGCASMCGRPGVDCKLNQTQPHWDY